MHHLGIPVAVRAGKTVDGDDWRITLARDDVVDQRHIHLVGIVHCAS